ncbi:MAG: helix-turn-helix domain-containing protein [Bacteroidota bacterium]
MNHVSLISTLDDVTNHNLIRNSNMKDYLKEVSSSLVSHLHLEDFVVYFKHRSKSLLKQVVKANKNDGVFIPSLSYTIEMGQGIVGSSAKQKTPIIVNDTSKNSAYISEDAFRYSELVVPIMHHNTIVGVLDSENSNKDFYNLDLMHLFGITAKLISFFLTESKCKKKENLEQEYYFMFINELTKNQLYLNEDLSAKEVADIIQISPAYFSHIVNKVSGQTFNSIVNSHRVHHIVDLLKKNEHQNRTLLAIAFASGFNSKSSFNLNFRRITKKSPSEFIAALRSC